MEDSEKPSALKDVPANVSDSASIIIFEGKIDSFLQEYRELKHKLAVAEKALEFYKDQWRYRGNVACPLNIEPNIKGDWDRGEIAKQALEVMRGEKQ